MNVYINSVTVEMTVVDSKNVAFGDNIVHSDVTESKNNLLLDLLEATLDDNSLSAEEKVKFFQIAFKSRKRQQAIETEEQKQ